MGYTGWPPRLFFFVFVDRGRRVNLPATILKNR